MTTQPADRQAGPAPAGGGAYEARRPRVAFVLEQTLGHVTHSDNLKALIPGDERLDASFAPVMFPVTGAAAHLPGYGNWTVRAGLRARRQIHARRRDGPIDALFVHTQVPAVLLADVMSRIPTVISLDATPEQYDDLGSHYGHEPGRPSVEAFKARLHRRCFARAAAIVTWSDWTKDGLVEDYGVPAGKITVIPPGVDVRAWSDRGVTGADSDDEPLRVLFVGGDFERKGGASLLAATALLRESGVAIDVDVVTRDEVSATPGVAVHHGLGPNSAELIALYQRADVFCLPTQGDCLPMVLSEAAAMGLPLVSTDVGAIREIVQQDRTGLLVAPGDAQALAGALRRLAADRPLRRRLGDEARTLAQTEFDARINARRLVDVIVSVTGR